MSKEQKAAAKICGRGTCYCGYNICANPSCKASSPVPLVGTDEECPLAKYHSPITPKPVTREELLALWLDKITRTELNALCRACDRRETDANGDTTQDCYFAHCLDCPVNGTREAMDENEAEARVNY